MEYQLAESTVFPRGWAAEILDVKAPLLSVWTVLGLSPRYRTIPEINGNRRLDAASDRCNLVKRSRDKLEIVIGAEKTNIWKQRGLSLQPDTKKLLSFLLRNVERKENNKAIYEKKKDSLHLFASFTSPSQR